MASGGQRRTRSERVAALELPPGQWERTWASLHRRAVLLRIALGVAAAVVLCVVMRGWDPPFVYRAGHVPQRDVTARVSFEAPSLAETDAARDRARRQARPVYVRDPQPLDELVAALESALEEVLAAESLAALDPRVWADFRAPSEAASAASEQDSQDRFEPLRGALADDRNLARFHQDLAAALEPLRRHGVLGKDAQILGYGGGEIVVYPVGQPDARETVKLADVQFGEGTSLHAALLQKLRKREVADPVFDWLRRQLTSGFSTLTRDDAATKKDRDAAEAAVKHDPVKYHAGTMLAVSGQPLTLVRIRVLRREYETAMAERPALQRLGRALGVIALILALFALSAFYLYRYERLLLVSFGRLAGMLALAVLTVFLSLWASADVWRAEIVPLLLFGQIVAIAYRQELAMLLSGAVAILLSLAIGHGLPLVLLLTGVTVTAVLQLARIRSRTKLIHVSLSAAVVAFLLTVVLAVVDNQPLSRPLGIMAACNALWTVAAGFLMTGLLPFIEHLFGVLTDISLLELGDVSHPVLQQLVQRAPSTYNHSITVGSIAEAAAEGIGARGLLARVGAYYHDIGKMLKPGYFIENQSPDDNRHQSLVPAMSTLVIIAHIKDGADLARQHNLPTPIIDLIEQHHGTTLVEYFYGRASEQALVDPNGGEVDESLYRYPGPKPQTKEAGVLMLADSAESAARTLVDPTPSRIESLVREIAERKLDDGQFDESGLTLRELRTIENSMIKSLIANYHGRVKYPEPKASPVRAG
jgi:hypothetical protein